MKIRYLIADSIPGRLLLSIAKRRNNVDKGALKILIYHDIPYEDFDKFEAQIKCIDRDYGFIRPGDLQDILAGKTKYIGTKALLTFDDGFQSNKVVAESVLQKMGVKAIFFVCPNFVELADSPEMKWKFFVADKLYMGRIAAKDISNDMQPMTWDDLKGLVHSGHTIGSHTLNHPELSSLVSEETLQNEIIRSGDLLERKLGIKVDSFAYPFGNCGSINKEAYGVIRERYSYCFTGLRGRNVAHTNPYYLLRDHVDIDSPTHYNDFILSGGWDWYYKSKLSKLLTKTAGHSLNGKKV